MGLFSAFVKSYKKTKKLRNLQLKISPPHQTIEDISANFMDSLTSERDEKGEALEEFFDLCINDAGVTKVLSDYSIDRNKLRDLYYDLLRAGFGQWIKGHHIALSTLAYYEPLLFYVESRRRNVSMLELLGALCEYWEGRIRQGDLLRSLQ